MVANRLSPGVFVRERDATDSIQSVGTTTGAFVGDFRWGPVDTIELINNETQLANTFGRPTKTKNVDFLTSASFLAYGSSFLVTRVIDGALNSVSSGTARQIKNRDSFGDGTTFNTTEFYAKYPGELGNSLKVSIADKSTFEGGALYAISDYSIETNSALLGAGAEVDVTHNGDIITKANVKAEVSSNNVVFEINDSGAGYDSGEDIISIGLKDGNKLSPNLTALLSSDGVGSITVDDTNNEDFIADPEVTITPADGDSGTGAMATATISNDGSISITVDQAGSGYAAAPTVTITGGKSIDIDGTITAATDWEYANQFDYIPDTTQYSEDLGVTNDELHFILIDEDGLFSGQEGTILEKFTGLSKNPDAKNYQGETIYYVDYINTFSNYVWVGKSPVASSPANGIGNIDWGNNSTPTNKFYYSLLNSDGTEFNNTFSFVGGLDSETPSDGDYQEGYNLYKDDANVDVSLIIIGDKSVITGDYVINNIAEKRKDCLVFISPQKASINADNPTTAIADEIKTRANSSFGVMDSGWKKMYDKYNDVEVDVPCNADTAGTCVVTDTQADPWFSPAGERRGNIRNVIKLLYNPNKEQRDILFKTNVNPIINQFGVGPILFGDKTMLRRESAFNAINVRRLFIVLEKGIARAAKSFLFEQNNVFTRTQFNSLVVPFLRNIQGRSGISDFNVISDETINTPDVIDAGEFRTNIRIKPIRSIRTIELTFVATRTGISFEELGV